MENGVVLSDPANNNNLFKKADDIGAAYTRIQDTDRGTFEVEMGGTDKLVTVSASAILPKEAPKRLKTHLS